MSETLKQRQAEILSEYEIWDDWLDKYQQIIQEGKKLPPFDVRYQTDEYFVKGCQSQVWFYHEVKEGKLFFYGKADSLIVQGLLALLIRAYSDATPLEILATPPEFIEKMGLDAHLSQTRQNGLYAVFQKMIHIAKNI